MQKDEFSNSGAFQLSSVAANQKLYQTRIASSWNPMANQDSQKSYHQYILKNRHANLQMIVKDAFHRAVPAPHWVHSFLISKKPLPSDFLLPSLKLNGLMFAQFLAVCIWISFHQLVFTTPKRWISEPLKCAPFSTVSNVGNAAAGWDVTWGTTRPGRGHHLFGQIFNEYPFANTKIWLFCFPKMAL